MDQCPPSVRFPDHSCEALAPNQDASLPELVGKEHGLYCRTRKGTLLESVPPGVTTWTLPVVAPTGTVVVIKELETTLKAAAAP
jgi:hypothetical protein